MTERSAAPIGGVAAALLVQSLKVAVRRKVAAKVAAGRRGLQEGLPGHVWHSDKGTHPRSRSLPR